MTTIKVKGHGEFSATEKMTARFEAMKKTELVKKIADGYSDKTFGVAHWREFPKETLMIIAADMLATDEERGKTPQPPTAAAPEPVVERSPEPAPIVPAAVGKAVYVLACVHRPGWLRRDQPRKPGDTASFKVVEDMEKASTYRSLRQAEIKLAEAAGLLDVPAEIKEVA